MIKKNGAGPTIAPGDVYLTEYKCGPCRVKFNMKHMVQPNQPPAVPVADYFCLKCGDLMRRSKPTKSEASRIIRPTLMGAMPPGRPS